MEFHQIKGCVFNKVENISNEIIRFSGGRSFELFHIDD